MLSLFLAHRRCLITSSWLNGPSSHYLEKKYFITKYHLPISRIGSFQEMHMQNGITGIRMVLSTETPVKRLKDRVGVYEELKENFSCLKATGTTRDTTSLGQGNGFCCYSLKLALSILRDPNDFIECPFIYP